MPPFERDPELMKRHRTTARGILLPLLALLISSGPAAAHPAAGGQPKVPRLVFPVLGGAQYIADFGAARPQGGHEGTDLMTRRRAVAVAAEAGRVKFWTTSARAGCMLYLEGASGTEYLYIHFNNDLTSSNDNRGKCVPGVAYAEGLQNGARVAAGQPIGYVGDSGDANGNPQLHFEVHPPGSGAVDPYPYLRKARQLLFAARPGSVFTLALTGKVVAAATDAVELSLVHVRQWPGGRQITQSGRTVAVSIPATTSFEAASALRGADPAYSAVDLLTRGQPVTVYTEPAKVTLQAQTGAKGTLAASRIVVGR